MTPLKKYVFLKFEPNVKEYVRNYG